MHRIAIFLSLNQKPKGAKILQAAFISGPALGHVGRLYCVAKELARLANINITFFVPEFSKAADTVINSDFDVVKIPISEEARPRPFGAFADQMHKHFQRRKFDLVVHDSCPLRWVSALRFPDCPRILITNAFLTGHHTPQTMQSGWFTSIYQDVNNFRRQNNLPELESPFDLYNADKVLLADPSELFQHLKDLPGNFEFCGPIFWESTGSIPDEIKTMNNILLISMGSTGRRELSPELITLVKRFSGSNHSVYAGQQFEKVIRNMRIDFGIEWLPLKSVFPQAACALSQGGAGSTYQALSYGVPIVTFPTYLNQEILGQHLEQLGYGVCIGQNDDLEKIQNFDIHEVRQSSRGASQLTSFQNGPSNAARQIMELL